MDALFSCRNCVHNAGQSIHVGPGQGFCIQHDTLLLQPDDTTCKYHHRKDLPGFVVDESRSEHAAEFANFPGPVSLRAKLPVRRVNYSEKYSWEEGLFDPVNNALAQYRRSKPKWAFVQNYAGSFDGRTALVHGSLIRRYMHKCGTWTSSYRMALALVDEMKIAPGFAPASLNVNGDDPAEVATEAKWDVFFARLSGLQEYGWHAGIEELMWASDGVNGGLAELDWDRVQAELDAACPRWLETIIQHAKEQDGFFTQTPDEEEVF